MFGIHPREASTRRPAQAVLLGQVIRAFAATVLAKLRAAFLRWRERTIERRLRQERFEREMYRGQYRHSSKNDDDLPVIQ
jgi:hypothetical protein